jgi:site-specific DNA-methyltransferase (adenine-specific)
VALPGGRPPALELPVMERNTIACADALGWLRSLEDGGVDVFWSSPPYNLADRLRGGNSVQTKVRHAYASAAAGGDGSLRPEGEYQDEQAAVLTEWFRCLAPEGVAFYNHKVRIKDGRAISPLEWICRTPFVLLQELVWDRGGTANVDDRRFLPVSERVYVLAKRRGVRLANKARLPDVLRFPPNHHKRAESGHPCPTHPTLVRVCLEAVARPRGGRLLVADPYMGSGTTALAARSSFMDYMGCDRSEEYVALAQRNLGGVSQPALLEAAG